MSLLYTSCSQACKLYCEGSQAQQERNSKDMNSRTNHRTSHIKKFEIGARIDEVFEHHKQHCQLQFHLESLHMLAGTCRTLKRTWTRAASWIRSWTSAGHSCVWTLVILFLSFLISHSHRFQRLTFTYMFCNIESVRFIGEVSQEEVWLQPCRQFQNWEAGSFHWCASHCTSETFQKQNLDRCSWIVTIVTWLKS